MDTQKAIEKVLQDFSRELMKVFSAAVVQAVGTVSGNAGNARSAALPAPAPAARRGRPPAAATATTPARPRAKARVAKAANKTAKPAPAPRGRPAKAKAAAPAKGKGGPRKSTPEEVQKLADKITTLLRKSTQNLSAKDMMKALGYNATDEGRFQYALNKMKDDGLVQQHGERRMARYGIGADAPKRAKGKGAESEAGADEMPPEA